MPNRVLITGCSQGIGLALALEFARAEWDVIATARRSDRPALQNAARAHANLQVMELDVTREPQIAFAMDAAAAVNPILDVLINNAAIFPGNGHESLESLDLEWFDDAFATNVTGVAAVTRAFLPMLRRSTHPRIINLSSGAGSISEKTDALCYPYSASKAALNMLTRTMANELRSAEITVAAISPGWVHTEMGGPEAPVSPDDCAAALRKTIAALTLADTGKFLDRHGDDSTYAW
jgi:NAD(P)-dependent dehydrogenase (short-subunit alcohol dehydrogenase family)